MITYTDITKSVLDGVERLIEDEFNIPVLYEPTGTESIIMRPVSDVFIEHIASAITRQFTTQIIYTVNLGGGWQSVKNKLTARTERIKRLLTNNTFMELNRWSDQTQSWQDQDAQWSALGYSYKWHEGQVADITYEQDEDDLDLWRSIVNFDCNVTEIG